MPEEEAVRRAESLGPMDGKLPLYGLPFAIKDNIDLAGIPTTAACPEFSYVPARSAEAVEKLIAAGAIPVGKTNLDQFATGLVGTRSPYGACSSVVDARYISGGSSSGSAVAVATGARGFVCAWDRHGGLRPDTGGLQRDRGLEADAQCDQHDGRGPGMQNAGLRVGLHQVMRGGESCAGLRTRARQR